MTQNFNRISETQPAQSSYELGACVRRLRM